jgi:hypothetical protein
MLYVVTMSAPNVRKKLSVLLWRTASWHTMCLIEILSSVMASIRARTNKDGSISYRADIRIKRAGKIVWRESSTYPRKKLSETWAAKRELQLAEPGALERAIAGLETNALTVSELIDRYVAEVFPLKPWVGQKAIL